MVCCHCNESFAVVVLLVALVFEGNESETLVLKYYYRLQSDFGSLKVNKNAASLAKLNVFPVG